jgi:hypothetical protein
MVMQINFALALSFAAAQYIFVSVFTPSGVINFSAAANEIILLMLVFLHSNAAMPTLLSLLFYHLRPSQRRCGYYFC